MEKCCIIIQNSNKIEKCIHQAKYGEYCSKHRRHYLIENDMINIHRFTFKIGDYYVKDLAHYYHSRINQTKKKYKKKYYFDEICQVILSLNLYNNSLPKIIKIQSLIRRYLILKQFTKNRKCNNNEDFYSYDSLDKIDSFYFYSYVDSKNFRWGFDIRSLMKLIHLGYPNPYTREMIPENIIQDIKTKIDLLKQDSKYEELEDIIERNRKEAIKQKVVDLFSDIELSGYSCQIQWFFNLRGYKLKELYKQLEDMWNYRCQLSQERKNQICPPDGRIFTIPVVQVLNYNCKEDLQELIVNEVIKFKNATCDSDKKLGYMYFIICLSMVSKDCYESHPWVSFILN